MKTSSYLASCFSKLHQAASSFINMSKSDWQMGGRSNLFVAAAYLLGQRRHEDSSINSEKSTGSFLHEFGILLRFDLFMTLFRFFVFARRNVGFPY